jgi:hypothetical protein
MGKIGKANDLIVTVIKADASAWSTARALKKLTPGTVEYSRARSTLQVWCEIIAKFTDEDPDVVFARYESVEV